MATSDFYEYIDNGVIAINTIIKNNKFSLNDLLLKLESMIGKKECMHRHTLCMLSKLVAMNKLVEIDPGVYKLVRVEREVDTLAAQSNN